MTLTRIRVEYDDYPDVSYVVNTEDEYAAAPMMSADCAHCGQPVTCRRVSYLNGRVLALHSRTGRIRCTTARHALLARRAMTYAEYAATYGDPDNYVSHVVTAERGTVCDQGVTHWTALDVISGFDLYQEDVTGVYDDPAEMPEELRLFAAEYDMLTADATA